MSKKAENDVSYLLLNQMTYRPPDSKNMKTKLKDTELQRIETITRQMQMKKLTHPRIANLKDQTNNTLLQDVKDPHDKGQYYMFYLDNA